MSCSWIPRRLSWSSSNLICVKWKWKWWHMKYRVFTIHAHVISLDWDMHNTQLNIIFTIIFFAICGHLLSRIFLCKEIFFNDALVSHCGLLKLQENKRMPREIRGFITLRYLTTKSTKILSRTRLLFSWSCNK